MSDKGPFERSCKNDAALSHWKVLVCYRECRHSMRPTMRGPGRMTQLPLARTGVTTLMLSPCGPSLLGTPEPPLCPSWPTSAQCVCCSHDRSEHLFEVLSGLKWGSSSVIAPVFFPVLRFDWQS